MTAMRNTTTIAAALLALAIAYALPTTAQAHNGVDDAALEASGERYAELIKDAELAERVDDQSRQMAPDAVRGECVRKVDVPGQGPSCLDSNGDWLVELPNGQELATHGGDAAAGMVWGAIPTDATTDAALAGASVASITCVTNPRVPHYRLIYTRPNDVADQSGTRHGQMRTELYKASAFVNEQAQRDGATTRKMRVWCSGGVPTIDNVVVPVNSASDDYSNIVAAVQGAGFTSASPAIERYLVYHEGIVGPGTWGYGGQAGGAAQTSQDPFGPNNAVGYVAIDYADADNAPIWYTMLHESLHTMGAVQNGAPDSNNNSHCFDDYDIMCYDDGSGPTTLVCPYLELDCSGDTYFNAGTPSGWLASSWNIGKPMNRFLDAGAQSIDYTTPTPVTGLAKTASTISSFTIGWTAGIDDVAITQYRVEVSSFSGGPWSTHSTSGSLTRTLSGYAPGTTRYARVIALDAAGNASTAVSGSFSTDADAVAPSVPGAPSASSVGQSTATISWGASTDNDQLANYVIERQIGASWSTLATVAPGSTSYGLSSLFGATPYTVAVRAVDRSGNSSARSSSTTFTTLSDTTPPTSPSNLSAFPAWSGTVDASWGISTDASGVSHYLVSATSSSGVAASTSTSSTSVTLQLTPGASYQLTVQAVDTVGNVGPAAATYFTVPTPPVVDNGGGLCPTGYLGLPPNCYKPTTTAPDKTKPLPPRFVRPNRSFQRAVRVRYIAGSDARCFHSTRVYRLVGRSWKLVRVVRGRGVRYAVVNGLKPRTAYRLKLHSRDCSGNLSTPVFVRVTTSR